MKVLILTAVILATASADRCRPNYHFWRPYNGSIPKDAVLAGTDEDGRRNYVAKIIPLDQYLWTVPAQWKENYDHLDFAWHESKHLMRVDKFIEILCSEDPDKLSWEKVNRFTDEITNRCCLVQGGIALYGDHIYNSYIGKSVVNGVNCIGRVYLERDWQGVHIMDGSNSTKIYNNFEVLSYNCSTAESSKIPNVRN